MLTSNTEVALLRMSPVDSVRQKYILNTPRLRNFHLRLSLFFYDNSGQGKVRHYKTALLRANMGSYVCSTVYRCLSCTRPYRVNKKKRNLYLIRPPGLLDPLISSCWMPHQKAKVEVNISSKKETFFESDQSCFKCRNYRQNNRKTTNI